MGKRRALVVVVVLAVVATALLVTSAPDVVLRVSQVEALRASQPDGKDLSVWMVTIEATNVTSGYLAFSSERAMVMVNGGGAWAKPDKAGLLGSIAPGETRDIALTVPPGSHACRFIFERRSGLSGKIERLLRGSRRLPNVSAWVVDHLPCRHFAVEVPLPEAPTRSSPKLDLAQDELR